MGSLVTARLQSVVDLTSLLLKKDLSIPREGEVEVIQAGLGSKLVQLGVLNCPARRTGSFGVESDLGV